MTKPTTTHYLLLGLQIQLAIIVCSLTHIITSVEREAEATRCVIAGGDLDTCEAGL